MSAPPSAVWGYSFGRRQLRAGFRSRNQAAVQRGASRDPELSDSAIGLAPSAMISGNSQRPLTFPKAQRPVRTHLAIRYAQRNPEPIE